MWRDKWVLFYSVHENQSHIDAYELLRDEGILPYETGIYGATRSLLQAMGLDITKSHVFHGTKYVGTAEEVQTYIYTLKRIYGEKLDAN
jgi:hypothetical protein